MFRKNNPLLDCWPYTLYTLNVSIFVSTTGKEFKHEASLWAGLFWISFSDLFHHLIWCFGGSFCHVPLVLLTFPFPDNQTGMWWRPSPASLSRLVTFDSSPTQKHNSEKHRVKKHLGIKILQLLEKHPKTGASSYSLLPYFLSCIWYHLNKSIGMFSVWQAAPVNQREVCRNVSSFSQSDEEVRCWSLSQEEKVKGATAQHRTHWKKHRRL